MSLDPVTSRFSMNTFWLVKALSRKLSIVLVVVSGVDTRGAGGVTTANLIAGPLGSIVDW